MRQYETYNAVRIEGYLNVAQPLEIAQPFESGIL